VTAEDRITVQVGSDPAGRNGRKALSRFRELGGSTTPDSRPSLLRNLFIQWRFEPESANSAFSKAVAAEVGYLAAVTFSKG